MIRSAACLLVAGLVFAPATGALAQPVADRPPDPVATGSAADARLGSKGPPAPSGSVTGRQPLPPARDAVQRGQRSFKRCNEEALMRKYRGAERRHFVARCRLGYGRRLFRRGAAPA